MIGILLENFQREITWHFLLTHSSLYNNIIHTSFSSCSLYKLNAFLEEIKATNPKDSTWILLWQLEGFVNSTQTKLCCLW